MPVYTWYTVKRGRKTILIGEGDGFLILSNRSRSRLLPGWGKSARPMVARYDGGYDAYIIDVLISEFIEELTGKGFK